MSSLLRDAIVDAKALREAALKNAEAAVIDRYSEEVRTTLNSLLEQEEAPLKEWYNNQLHEALLKKFNIKK